jgi:hypothetical protein
MNDDKPTDPHAAPQKEPGPGEKPSILIRAEAFYEQGNYPEALKLVTFHQARNGSDLGSDLLLFKIRKKLGNAIPKEDDAPAPLTRDQVMGKIRKHYGLGNFDRALHYVHAFESQFGRDMDVDMFRYKIERKAPHGEGKTGSPPPSGEPMLDSILTSEPVPPAGFPAEAGIADLFSLDESDLQPSTGSVKTSPPASVGAGSMEWGGDAPPAPRSPEPEESGLISLNESDLQPALQMEPLSIEVNEDNLIMNPSPLENEPSPLPDVAIAFGADETSGAFMDETAVPRATGSAVPPPDPAPADSAPAASIPNESFPEPDMLEWPEPTPTERPLPAAPPPPPPAASIAQPSSKPGLDGLPLYYPPVQADAEFKVTGTAPGVAPTMYADPDPAAISAPMPADLPEIPRESRGSRRFFWLAVVAAIVVIGAGAYYFLALRNPAGGTETPGETAGSASTRPDGQRSATTDQRSQRLQRILKEIRDEIGANRIPEAIKKIQQAKSIRITPEVLNLELLVKEKQKEAAAATPATIEPTKEPEPVSPQDLLRKRDEETFQRASQLQTSEAYREYLNQFPWGNHHLEVEKAIAELQDWARRDLFKQLEERAIQEQRVRLPTQPRDLAEATARTALSRVPSSGGRLETMTFEGDAVLADFSCGLMWHLWDNPMDFDKASMWSIRRWAGFSNWRMPTIEEAAALAVALRNSSGVSLPAALEIWTGDRDNAVPSNRWVVRMSDLNLRSLSRFDLMRLCAVRSIRR